MEKICQQAPRHRRVVAQQQPVADQYHPLCKTWLYWQTAWKERESFSDWNNSPRCQVWGEGHWKPIIWQTTEIEQLSSQDCTLWFKLEWSRQSGKSCKNWFPSEGDRWFGPKTEAKRWIAVEIWCFPNSERLYVSRWNDKGGHPRNNGQAAPGEDVGEWRDGQCSSAND